MRFFRIIPASAAVALVLAVAGCDSATIISPNDPAYGASGAPGGGSHFYKNRGPYKPLGDESSF